MSTTAGAAEPTTAPHHELGACARRVAELLNRLADSAESNQPEAVGYWMEGVQKIQASIHDQLMTAAVAAGASWAAIGAAQDPPVSRQAAQQRYQRLVRRIDVNSEVDVVAEPRSGHTRHLETSDPAVNERVDGSSGHLAHRQAEPPPTGIVSAGGTWAADDRRDLVRASDYQVSGVWLVTADGVMVGSVQPTYSGARTKRWTALINGMPILGGRSFPSRDKAAIQVLVAHRHLKDQAGRSAKVSRKPAQDDHGLDRLWHPPVPQLVVAAIGEDAEQLESGLVPHDAGEGAAAPCGPGAGAASACCGGLVRGQDPPQCGDGSGVVSGLL